MTDLFRSTDKEKAALYRKVARQLRSGALLSDPGVLNLAAANLEEAARALDEPN